MTQVIQQEDIQKLDAFSSPWALVKKAFSSVLLMLLIGSGFLINWILAIVFLIGWFSSTSWLWIIVGFLMLFAVFPVAYLFSAYWYGQSLLFWEAYREIIRPVSAKIFSGVLDATLKENAEGKIEVAQESTIVKELESRSKYFIEKLPDFIRAYFQIFITGKDVIKIINEQRKSGKEKAAVKEKAMTSMYEALDLQMSELTEPSMIPTYIILGINILTVYFLMFY